MKKRKIAVIFGGRSVEHEVSILTAHVPIIEALKAMGQFEIWPVYIAKNGNWYSDLAMNKLDYFKKNDFETQLTKQKKIQLDINDGLKLTWPGFRSKIVEIDIVFPAMHGTFGEDGSLMGLLRMANVPFVGCDLFASSVAMDKVITKQVISAENISIVPYLWFTKNEWETEKEILKEKIKKLKWPMFVKPVHLGSSIGISKVKNELELENAIEVALHYDTKVLVEEGVENLIEVTLPIMGNDQVRFGAIERPLNKSDFFDFEDKYLVGGKNGGVNNQFSEIPAKIGKELAGQVEELGEKTYKVLGCWGIARIDFLIDSVKNKVYVNEVNTLPGSLYDHNWRKIGVSRVDLVKKLIELADEKFSEREKITYTFETEILKMASGGKMGGL